MKKKVITSIILITILIGTGYFYFHNYYVPKLDIENEQINIDDIYIYGTHLNIMGNTKIKDNSKLVLYNGNFKEIDIINENENFYLSKKINDGLFLENIPIGKYYLFLRNGNKNDGYKYYALNNNTKYKNTVYYTFSKNNNKINITSEDSYPTMIINVEKNKEKEIYDIVIDPGHGGMDSGALYKNYKESSFTMDIALGVKKKLEENGIKVKLTREKNQLKSNELLEEYGPNGRAVIPQNVHAKYIFSIHINSNPYKSVNGLEIYTAKNLNYDFVNKLSSSIVDGTGLNYSSNKNDKVHNGVYAKNFNNNDILNSKKEKIEKNLKPYNITSDSNYFYIIRETGGKITGAFVDERNKNILSNPYVNSNVGVEAYLLELGFITNQKDLNNLLNNIDSYINSISESIITLYNN